MKRLIILTILATGLVAGCSSNDSGDVEAANKAAAQAPKSADQLPTDMPPEARKQAESAIAQQQAMSQQANTENDARMRAMQGMRGK